MRLGEWVLKGLSACVLKYRRVLSPLPPIQICCHPKRSR